MPHHRHSFHELIIPIAGRVMVQLDMDELTATVGDILFYPAHTIHSETSDPLEPVESIYIAFEDAQATKWLRTKLSDRRTRVRQLVTWLLEDRFSNARASGEASRAFFSAILAELRRLQDVVESDMVLTIRAQIGRHLDRHLTLDDLAQWAQMSRFGFARKYKKLAGRAPMEDLRAIRIQRARDLILTSGQPLKWIASQVGLSDEYHLSKLFKRHYGLSPARLRHTASTFPESPAEFSPREPPAKHRRNDILQINDLWSGWADGHLPGRSEFS